MTGTSKGKSLGTHDAFFPNRVIETRPDMRSTLLRPQLPHVTMDIIKQSFARLLSSKTDVAAINAQQKRADFAFKNSRVAVRKVLSHYWDNSSIFGLDLVGAVLRQGTFVQKMAKLEWIRSPGGMGTVQRAIVKYHRFVGLSRDNGGRMVVPTLDVDLAWVSRTLLPYLPMYRCTWCFTKWSRC